MDVERCSLSGGLFVYRKFHYNYYVYISVALDCSEIDEYNRISRSPTDKGSWDESADWGVF